MHTTGNRGFTLIELMIAVAIIAIISAIAYPSYVRYVQRADRSAAEQFMLSIANQEDQYLLDAHQYAIDSGGTPAWQTLGLSQPSKVQGTYTITVTSNSNPPLDYTITAAPLSSGAMAGDGNLTLNNVGTKTGNWDQ